MTSDAMDLVLAGDGNAFAGHVPSRASVMALEAALAKLPQLDIEGLTTHHFGGGVYARTIHLAAGSCVTGKIHKTENLNVLAQGEISVLTDHGMQRLAAPQIIVSSPGTKRVGFAHTDVVWITLHATDTRDLKEIEAKFIATTWDDLMEIEATPVAQIEET